MILEELKYYSLDTLIDVLPRHTLCLIFDKYEDIHLIASTEKLKSVSFERSTSWITMLNAFFKSKKHCFYLLLHVLEKITIISVE